MLPVAKVRCYHYEQLLGECKIVLNILCLFQGTTGFPWIDAVMRQLRIEGWIPHVARQAVGCFLTRGCLWVNWEEGYKVDNK